MLLSTALVGDDLDRTPADSARRRRRAEGGEAARGRALLHRRRARGDARQALRHPAVHDYCWLDRLERACHRPLLERECHHSPVAYPNFTVGAVEATSVRHDASAPQPATDRATLDPRALGLTGGITLAVWVVTIGLLSHVGWGDRWRRLFADLYPGFDSSARGLAIGAIWAFVDGSTVGAAFAWLYNEVVE